MKPGDYPRKSEKFKEIQKKLRPFNKKDRLAYLEAPFDAEIFSDEDVTAIFSESERLLEINDDSDEYRPEVYGDMSRKEAIGQIEEYLRIFRPGVC